MNFTLRVTIRDVKYVAAGATHCLSGKDKSGNTVLEAVSDEPIPLAKLPAGTYSISAEHDGEILSKTVHVKPQGVTQASFLWKPTAEAATG